MASNYNFDDAYATDSFTDDDWDNICEHVGVDIVSEEERSDDIGSNEGNASDRKTEQNSENEGVQDISVDEGNDLEEKDENENIEVDFVSELRKDMKSLRKNLRKGRVQLLNFDQNDLDAIEETYKEFKHTSKRVKKNLKEFVYNKKGQVGKKDPVDTKRANIPVDAPSEMDKSRSASKPIHSSYQGHQRYRCPSCDYIARSMGRTYAHMVDKHNAKPFACKQCPFTTKNPTSLHNHYKLYCPKKEDK